MGWTIRGWTRWALAGLAVVVLGVGGAAAFLFRARTMDGQDVVYGEAGGRTLRLDVYRPDGPATAKRPCVILIHGGGWVYGDKAWQRDIAGEFTRAGFVAISVGYRLAKDDASRYPAQVDDVRRAVRWVRAHADELGIDPDRLGAHGHSAGGHLSAILGTTDARGTGDPDLKDYSSRVQCVVDCSGPSDFTDESSPALGPEAYWMVPNLFGKARNDAPDAYRDASPVSHVDARSAPTLLIHGTLDDVVPIDQSRKLRDALARAGVEVELIEIEGERHNFEKPESGARLVRESLAFFRRHLKP